MTSDFFRGSFRSPNDILDLWTWPQVIAAHAVLEWRHKQRETDRKAAEAAMPRRRSR